jgi:hypothetical protein
VRQALSTRLDALRSLCPHFFPAEQESRSSAVEPFAARALRWPNGYDSRKPVDGSCDVRITRLFGCPTWLARNIFRSAIRVGLRVPYGSSGAGKRPTREPRYCGLDSRGLVGRPRLLFSGFGHERAGAFRPPKDQKFEAV